jgi:hypothetical protein
MRPETYTTDDLHNYLKKNMIASMDELKRVLGTDVNKTVFRKLKKLSYRSSYSHRGKFYTTDSIADFDILGLWSYNDIYFSKYGTLLYTVKYLIENSEAGYSVRELDDILHVSTKEALLNIYKKEAIYREKFAGLYLYFSTKSTIRKHQIQIREKQQEALPSIIIFKENDKLSDKAKAAIILFFSILNEKQRRLYAGLESLKLGHGGDQKISELLGINAHTIAKGKKELLSDDITTDRIRNAGGGNKNIKKKFQK